MVVLIQSKGVGALGPLRQLFGSKVEPNLDHLVSRIIGGTQITLGLPHDIKSIVSAMDTGASFIMRNMVTNLVYTPWTSK